jgi:RHH-type proline utilization regulon transcriptional repressor/proline dehydrogenase/delta 1-pyrroline-5-carboxylate dehydrogenase
MIAINFDDRIHQIGSEIFARIHRNGFASPIEKIDDRLMAWSMRDESFKSQLFRFVDCLPSLRSSAEITQHLREYLNIHIPGLSPLVAAAARLGASRMAHKFIAAPDLDHAAKTIAWLRDNHLDFTIDLLG